MKKITFKRIGRCGTCAFQVASDSRTFKICINSHLIEPIDLNESGYNKDDCLIYSYDEGGFFEVGDNFGCIYWQLRDENKD